MDWPTDVLTDHPIGGPADCEPLPLGISPRLWHRVCQLAQRFERPFVWRYMAPGAPPPIGDPAASQRNNVKPRRRKKMLAWLSFSDLPKQRSRAQVSCAYARLYFLNEINPPHGGLILLKALINQPAGPAPA